MGCQIQVQIPFCLLVVTEQVVNRFLSSLFSIFLYLNHTELPVVYEMCSVIHVWLAFLWIYNSYWEVAG